MTPLFPHRWLDELHGETALHTTAVPRVAAPAWPIHLAAITASYFQYRVHHLLFLGYREAWTAYLPLPQGAPLDAIHGWTWQPDDPDWMAFARGRHRTVRGGASRTSPPSVSPADFTSLVAESICQHVIEGDPRVLAADLAVLELLACYSGAGSADLTPPDVDEVTLASAGRVVRARSSKSFAIDGTAGGRYAERCELELRVDPDALRLARRVVWSEQTDGQFLT